MSEGTAGMTEDWAAASVAEALDEWRDAKNALDVAGLGVEYDRGYFLRHEYDRVRAAELGIDSALRAWLRRELDVIAATARAVP